MAAALGVRGALGAAIARLEVGRRAVRAPWRPNCSCCTCSGETAPFLYAHPEAALDADQTAALFARLIEQRAAGTPVQYLTGRQEFWGLEFEVNPSVLIPRPETEHVVEVALARYGCASRRSADRRGRWHRLGLPGRGARSVSCRTRKSSPRIFQRAALEVAASQRGAARRGGARRVSPGDICWGSDLADSRPVQSRCFDLIVSNPPYIGLAEAASLPREVREHEPRAALFAVATRASEAVCPA
jgi:release factor glutamine methyltransferase